ncbi:hypothetical protein NQ318_021437 [Aromia moschata]|uniref:Uncharacterized protein n=1 Tax=Aromia moschata TaxID=1265417 RepID=A0AAV8ZCE1_9CUCU|nr:hypothetical protein NQ318_021437 [Aromia moschata]
MFTYAIFSALLAAAAVADPPRLNSRFSRQFQQPENAPVQPLDQKVFQGQIGQFFLLSRLQNVPQSAGEQPSQQGEVNPRDGDAQIQPGISTKVAEKNVTDVEVEQRDSTENDQRNEKLTEGRKEAQGVYYIYHPDGLLQKSHICHE